MSDTLAIIPARGGSKGVPRKNIRLLGGVPLVARTVQQASIAACVDRVVVSTDDPEIARVAATAGAEVIHRPQELATDSTSSEAALIHVLGVLDQQEGYSPEVVVFLQCTSPLTLAEDIEKTVALVGEGGADSAFAAVPFHHFLWQHDERGTAVGINHDPTERQMRQDRPPQFLESGAVYAMRTKGLLRARHRFHGRVAMHVMPQERCLEIDEPRDFAVAEALIRHSHNEDLLAKIPASPAALVMDFDGVLTDNTVTVMQDGTEAVSCSRGDGWGLARLTERGIPLLVLSQETNSVVSARCAKMGIPCLQGIDDKLPRLMEWLEDGGLDPSEVLYVGNDLADLACMRAVGCGVAVGDAHSVVRQGADVVLEGLGGKGAVRELCELILERTDTK